MSHQIAAAKITIRATRIRPADIDPDEFDGDLTDQLAAEGFNDIELADGADGEIDLGGGYDDDNDYPHFNDNGFTPSKLNFCGGRDWNEPFTDEAAIKRAAGIGTCVGLGYNDQNPNDPPALPQIVRTIQEISEARRIDDGYDLLNQMN